MAFVAGPTANLGNIREVSETILGCLGDNYTVGLDLSMTGEVDLTLLQVMAATAKLAERDGKTLTMLQPPSAAIIALMERAGFESLPGWQDNSCNAGAAGQ